ncbi:MAG: hypothetical protein ACE1ZA_19630, partial [Pseudomonadales bacterium]
FNKNESNSRMRICQFVIDYEQELPGSDVSDPRIRCGEPATFCVRGSDADRKGIWLCKRHAQALAHRGAGSERPGGSS